MFSFLAACRKEQYLVTSFVSKLVTITSLPLTAESHSLCSSVLSREAMLIFSRASFVCLYPVFAILNLALVASETILPRGEPAILQILYSGFKRSI